MGIGDLCMSKHQYIEQKFHRATLDAIETANTIIEEYQAQGFRLTLRQLYYQHVARGLIENTEKSYKKMGSIINDGRMAGLIDWDSIEDRTRNLQSLNKWGSPRQIIRAAYSSYREDKWLLQPNRIEVWVEKDALIGVIEGICQEYEVDYFACRGYTSQSEMRSAAERIRRYIENGQEVTIIHLGDHDPSGIDMSRDIYDRLDLFLEGDHCDVNRIALNYDQVTQYNPPPNPAKSSDSRFYDYQREYGDESWELDALEPRVIAALIEEEILGLRDEDKWIRAVDEEEQNKKSLRLVDQKWSQVVDWLGANQ